MDALKDLVNALHSVAKELKHLTDQLEELLSKVEQDSLIDEECDGDED